MLKTACIFGATGLVGNYLTEQLLEDDRYATVIVFVRSDITLEHPKLKKVVGDYEQLDNYYEQLIAEEYYCCLGTTMKKAKTKEAFEYVDYQLPLKIGNLAKKNNVAKYCVVSSIGASSKNSNFYLSTKGRMEEAISSVGIEYLHFFRPSLLLGERNEKRFGESMAKLFSKLFGAIMIGGLKNIVLFMGKLLQKQ
ncbi:MAG: NAD(P)H-binding protein [Chloroflexia bacterium]|nr:NAD(P)H-binding protein [Chloroflexia bacterium]